MFSYLFGCSLRLELAIFLFIGVCIIYTLRVNISVAATKMESDLDWSVAQKGYVLSSFYWGYSLGQIPSATLIQRYGGKTVLALSVLFASVLTLLNPITFERSFTGGLILRALIGLVQSASFPAVYYFFNEWIPVSERTYICPIVTSGSYLGEIVGFAISGALVGSNIDLGNWQSTFYIFGFLGLLWYPLFIYFIYDKPELHPHISLEERELISGTENQERRRSETHYFVGLVSGVNLTYIKQAKPLSLPEDDRKAKSFVNFRSPNNNDFFTSNGKESNFRRAHSLGGSDKSSTMSITGPQLSLSSLKQSLLNNKDNNQDGHKKSIVNFSVSGTDDNNSSSKYDKLAAVGINRNSGDFEKFREYNIDSRESNYTDINEQSRTNDQINQESLFNSIPWSKFFTHKESLTLFFNHFTFGFVEFLLISEMPSFLVTQLGFSEGTSGLLSAIPFGFLFIVVVASSRFFDRAQTEYNWEISSIRQIAQISSFSGVSIFLIGCGFATSSPYLAFTFLVIAQAFIGVSLSGIGCAYLDLAPLYSCPMFSIGWFEVYYLFF
jgi:MFS family permease